MASPQPPAPSDSTKASLHGRGGAGNIGSRSPNQVNAEDLQTPTIKSSHYTTGRGGSGNITSNDSAENARKAQDVDAPAHHQHDPKGTYHWGRGGEGNMMTVGGSNEEKKEHKERKGSANKGRSGSFRDALNKSKEVLGLKGKDGKGEKGGSAVEDD